MLFIVQYIIKYVNKKYVIMYLKYFYRHEDLKQMLDSNKDGLKLEAMKRIIGVISQLYLSNHLSRFFLKSFTKKSIKYT